MARLRICLVLVLCSAACAGRPPVARPSATPSSQLPQESLHGSSPIVLEPLRIVVGPGEGSASAYDARALFEEGNDALMQHQLDAAVKLYDRLLEEFPESRLGPLGLYNAGLALEGKADFAAAAERYRSLLTRPDADAATTLDAQFRLGAVLAEADRYDEAAKVFEATLARKDLGAASRIEALSRLGFALLSTSDFVGAEEVLRSALAYHREIAATQHVDDDYYVAMCQYYLAAIPHRQFDVIPLRMPREQLGRDIAQKSDLFLLARDRYIKTVELKNPYWATAAVYQIGMMYKTFWDQFMAVPIPADLPADAIGEYVKAINEEPELKKLLEKAILYHERNVTMAKNAHLATAWSEASGAAAEEVLRLIARQATGELIRPGAGEAASRPVDPAGSSSDLTPAKEYVPARPEL